MCGERRCSGEEVQYLAHTCTNHSDEAGGPHSPLSHSQWEGPCLRWFPLSVLLVRVWEQRARLGGQLAA